MIVRGVVALKDATGGIGSSCGGGTSFDLGALESCQGLYAGLHVLSSGNAANFLRVWVVAGSSSGFTASNPGTCHFEFTAVTCRNGEWGTPITTAFGTCQNWYRAEWATCNTTRKFLTWVARSC